MKTIRFMTVAALTFGGALAVDVAQHAQAQAPGITRTDLQRHDLSVPGREVVQVRVESLPVCWPPGTAIRAKRSSIPSKACWNTSWTASRR